jgi:hypothetical protein
MRNTKIPLHIKQAAFVEYKKGSKVVDILKKYNICFGTLYTYIHKQEQISKTFHDNDSSQISTSKPPKSKPPKSKPPKSKPPKSKPPKSTRKHAVNIAQNGGFNNDSSILSIDDALLELANL